MCFFDFKSTVFICFEIYFMEILRFLICPFSALIQPCALLSYGENFSLAPHTHFDYRTSYDDRQGFVGTPGPAKWRGAPACFAAERPSPKVSFFRVFGPCGLQPFSPQSAQRLSRDACAFAEPFRRRLRGPAGAGHKSLRRAGARGQFTARCLPCRRAPGRNHPWRAGRAADRHRAE